MEAPLVIRTRADSDELRKAALSIEQAAWSELGYLNYTRAHFELYTDLLTQYADYQLCLVNEETNYPVAVANCVPLTCSGPDDLPPEGWDWLVETAARPKAPHKMLGALAISVPAIHRSKGYARIMIRALLDLAESKGLHGLVAPVRPSAKAHHPRGCAACSPLSGRRRRPAIHGSASTTTSPGPMVKDASTIPGFAATSRPAASS